ncbi:MAG: DUF2069 domain-containing protein [Pseudomonadales bacterium]|jgi:uncharacterized membrane protein
MTSALNPPRMAGFQFLTLLCLGSLFAITGLRQFFMTPLANPVPNALWFLVQVSPVIAVLPGVLRGHGRGFFYAMLAALPYFLHGIVIVTGGERGLGMVESGAAIALLAVCYLALRRLPRGAGGAPS